MVVLKLTVPCRGVLISTVIRSLWRIVIPIRWPKRKLAVLRQDAARHPALAFHKLYTTASKVQCTLPMLGKKKNFCKTISDFSITKPTSEFYCMELCFVFVNCGEKDLTGLLH
eukprot:scpid94534/ scgid30096/ 